MALVHGGRALPEAREIDRGGCTAQDDVRQLLGMPKPESAALAADTSLEKAFGMDKASGKPSRKMSSRSEGKTYETLEEGSGFRVSRKLVLTSALFLLAAGGVVMIYQEFGVSNNPPSLITHTPHHLPPDSSSLLPPHPPRPSPTSPPRPRPYHPPTPLSYACFQSLTPTSLSFLSPPHPSTPPQLSTACDGANRRRHGAA